MTYIFILIGGFFAIHIALSLMAIPHRRRLAELCNELQHAEMTVPERMIVNHLAVTAYSWRAAIVIATSFFRGLFQSGSTLDRQFDEFARQMPFLASDPRALDLREAFHASAIATNPVCGIVVIVLRAMFRLKARLHHSAKAAREMTDFIGSAAPV